jgi:hypothetical protein
MPRRDRAAEPSDRQEILTMTDMTTTDADASELAGCPRCDGLGAHLTGCNDVLARATELGTDAGRAAASWVFDGNTSRETYARVLAGIDDGDPAVMDAYREPSLSGEFADDYSEAGLAWDLGIEPYTEASDAACRAWEEAASAEFWAEIERAARAALA